MRAKEEIIFDPSIDDQGCSTVIIGKKASATGTVIIGHNEDNAGRLVTPQYFVPAADHGAGEMLQYEPSAAKIPQVPHTYAFYWSQTLSKKGNSFSDCFVNENGVVIVSNNCAMIFEENKTPLKDGGVGYAIRRLMAERGQSARHAIEVAAALLDEYGYLQDGRTYTVADCNEVWQIAIHQGGTYVAQRLKDDEVLYIPNNFMMNKVDATDKKNVIVSKGLIERAIAQGRYKPKKAGVYKDFNFREAVQPFARRDMTFNKNRNKLAWKYLTGKTMTHPDEFPYRVKATRKFTVEDVRNILRLHEKEIGTGGFFHETGFGVCRPTTHESEIFVMDKNPLFIMGFRAYTRPCTVPYVPFFPLAGPAAGAAFLPHEVALRDHFASKGENVSYNVEWPVWAFVNHGNIIDSQKDKAAANRRFVDALDREAEKEAFAALANAKMLPEEKRREYMHNFNVKAFNKAHAEISLRTEKVSPYKMSILASSIDSKAKGNVKMVVYSTKDFDATKLKAATTYAGYARSSFGTGTITDLAKAISVTYTDVNKDGKKDAVFTFKAAAVAANLFPGVVYDVWLYTEYKKKPISAFDVVKIV